MMRIIAMCMIVGMLSVSCDVLRSTPTKEPLSFKCKADISEYPINLSDATNTKVPLTLTPLNEGTRAGGLTLSSWNLPKGLHGILLDDQGEAIVAGRVLDWGKHEWSYTPTNVGGHTITLQLNAPYEANDVSVKLDAIKVLDRNVPNQGPYVTTWLRPLSVNEKMTDPGEEALALEVWLERVPENLKDHKFTLEDFHLPESLAGKLKNKAKDQLRFFPLSTTERNTFFVVFKNNGQIADASIQFHIKCPNDSVIYTEVKGGLLADRLGRKAVMEQDNRGFVGNTPIQQGNIVVDVEEQLAQHALAEAAVGIHGTPKKAVAHLCSQDNLTPENKVVLRKLVTKTPGMLCKGQRPLRLAAYQMNLDAVKILLAIPDAIGKDTETPVLTLLSGFMEECYAKSRGIQADKDAFDLLFDALIEVPSIINEGNSIGRTPFMHASGMGALGLIKKLVNKGVEVTAKTTGQANYRLSCKVNLWGLFYNDRNMGGELIKVTGWTALHEATARQHTACIEFLNKVSSDWPIAWAKSYRYKRKTNNANEIRFEDNGFYLP